MPSRPQGNPWLSIWTRPRLTIAEIVRTKPSYRFFLFCFIYGFVALLQGAQQADLGTQFSAGPILLVSAIAGFFLGFVFLSISSLLLMWTGRWIKGKGTYHEVRAAVAWSNVPVAVDLIIWLALAAVFGPFLFTQDFASVAFLQSSDISALLTPQVVLLIGLGIVRLALNIWSIVILIGSLSQVQGFSIFKAILNILIAVALVIAAIILSYFIIGMVQG